MTDAPELHLATPEEVVQTLSFALRYNGKKRVHTADEWMARVAAERLVQHLERSGFVVMKKPPATMHDAPAYGRHPADGPSDTS